MTELVPGKPLRVLVCGGRDYADYERLHYVLSNLPVQIACIIEGGATGADHCAKLFALSRGIPVETYRADWSKNGRAAGPIRNHQMIVEGKPDMVLAFPGGKGTANMIAQAKQHNIYVAKAPEKEKAALDEQ